MRRLMAMATLGLALVACGNGGEGAESQGSDAGEPVGTAAPATTVLEPEVTTTVARASENPIGTEVRTEAGNTVVVYAYEGRTTAGPSSPPPGKVFAAADVGGCAGPEGVELGLNPFDFELQMPDNTRLQPSYSGSKEPRLRSSPLPPGECIRGWITFEVPQATKAKAIIFNGSSVVKWSLP
jgi:hypothetical protein